MGAIFHSNQSQYKQFRYSKKRQNHLSSRGYDVGTKFPVGELQRHFRQRTRSRFFITDDAAVFTTAVIEYLCAEILEQAGLFTSPEALSLSNSNCHSKVIQPSHLQLVFLRDLELRLMLGNLLPTSTVSKNFAEERDLCHVFQSLSVKR